MLPSQMSVKYSNRNNTVKHCLSHWCISVTIQVTELLIISVKNVLRCCHFVIALFWAETMFSRGTRGFVMSSLKRRFKAVRWEDSEHEKKTLFPAFAIVQPDIYLVARIVLMQSNCRQMSGLFVHKQGQTFGVWLPTASRRRDTSVVNVRVQLAQGETGVWVWRVTR